MPRHRPVLLALLAMWVGTVAFLTLAPAGHTPPLTLRHFRCITCGDFAGSDMLRNWILFLPGGLLAGLVFERARGLGLLVLFTCLIEFVQIGVPGRDPALPDLLFNTLGAWTGVTLARRGIPAWSRGAVGVVVALAWLGPLILLIPRTTPYELYGQWTPRFGGSIHYDGRILDAELGGITVESGQSREKEVLDEAIVERKPIRALLVAGEHPASWAPVFQIVDAERRGVIELGALDADLLLRGRNLARTLKLDQPDARWVGAMEGVAVGDTVTLVVDRGRGSVCMSIDGREQCNLAPTLADGWGHVLYLEGLPRRFRELMSLMWVTGLGGLIGLASGSRRTAMIFVTVLAAAGYVGPVLSPDVSPSALHAAMLVAGALIGTALRHPVVRLWKELRPA